MATIKQRRHYCNLSLTWIPFLCLCLMAVLVIVYLQFEQDPTLAVFVNVISANCSCWYKGNLLDFCYHHPDSRRFDSNMRFSCRHAAILDSLDLIAPQTRSSYFEKSQSLDPVIVTAFSENHWPEAMHMISSIRKHRPQQKLVVYDLGLENSTVNQVKSLCNVEFRRFPFEVYPYRIRLLNEFRWKPIVIAATVRDFGVIWYMDTSVIVTQKNLDHVYNLLNCRKNAFKLPSKFEDYPACRKFPYLLHGYTGHGIFSATDSGVYRFFPVDLDAIRTTNARMYEAGLALVVRTRETMDLILKWYVLCALEDSCMAPGDSRVPRECVFDPSDRFAVSADCHRFDQSIVNVLLANANHYDYRFYASEIVDFFSIRRDDEMRNETLACE